MADQTTTRRAMLATTGTALAALSGCVAVGGGGEETTETEAQRFDAAETSLEIANINGPITVEGTDTDEIVLELEKTGTDAELDATNVTTDRTDGRLGVETTHDSGVLSGLLGPSTATITMTVQCPRDVTVERVETTNGDVTVHGVAGPVALETTNGQITADELGSVGDVSSTNGEIDVTVPAIESDVEIESVNGAIDVALGPDLNADLNAETTVGEVSVDGDLGLTATDGEASGTLGDGGPDLAIESTNGEITLTAAE